VVLYLSFMKIKDAKDEEGERGTLFTQSHLFDLTAIVFIILAFICFFGITAPIYSKLVMHLNANPTEREFFNTLAYPFTMLLMLIIGVCLPYKPIVKKIGAQKYLIVAAVILLLSIILAFIVPGPEYYVINHSSPFYKTASGITQMLGSLSLLSYVPIFLFSLAAIVYRFVLDVRGTKDSKRLMKPAGITMIHLGTILLLLGVIVSQSFDVTYRMNYADSELGEIQYVSKGSLDDYGNYKDYSENPLGLELVLNNGDAIHTVSTSDRMVEGLTKNAFHINLYRDGRKVATGAALYWIELYDEDLDGTFERVEWTNIMDDEKLFRTYHVKYGGRIGDGYNFVIKEIPLISAVWIGSVLMCIGVLLTFADQQLFGVKEKIKFKAKPGTAPGAPAKKAGRKRKKPVPKESGAADKYEKMLREELEAAKK
ncbi:MAG: hypothetical protein K8R08_11235, partial [Methanosarcinales archaeon]|nr:hypothetical protein [Methanosarcinales archaeon]